MVEVGHDVFDGITFEDIANALKKDRALRTAVADLIKKRYPSLLKDVAPAKAKAAARPKAKAKRPAKKAARKAAKK